MRIKLLTNVWLRICMIVAVVTTAFAGTAWANEPITVALEEFTATNDVHLDGNVHYTTTGTLQNGMIYVPYDGTFTVSVTNGLITSVSLVSATNTSVKYQPNNVNRATEIWNVQPDVPVTVTSSGCSSVTFTNIEYNYQLPFPVYYLSVTYIPSNPVGWTLRAKTNNTSDQFMGSVKVNGNVVVATPLKGYGYATPAFTVETTPTNNVVVEQVGNEFSVTSVPEGTTVEVTVNFAPHATDNKITFEKDLLNYSTDWTFTNIERNNVDQDKDHPAIFGRRYGKATATTASITTANPIPCPNTFSCYVAKMDNYVPSAKWTIEVSGDKNTWTKVGEKEFADNDQMDTWVMFSANLSGHTNVYVRLSYSANSHNYSTQTCLVDDIVLTENASSVNNPTIPVRITDALYATFTPAYSVSLPTGLSAYKVTGATSTSVTTERLTTIPLGTPVVLKGSEAKTYYLPIIESADADVSGNLLQVSDGFKTGDGSIDINNSNIINGSTIFVLAKKTSNGVGFYRMYPGDIIPAGKAYLVITGTSGVKEFYGFEDEATGIKTIDNGQQTTDAAIYNLAGQRMNKMQKGINIVNGKKILK